MVKSEQAEKEFHMTYFGEFDETLLSASNKKFDNEFP